MIDLYPAYTADPTLFDISDYIVVPAIESVCRHGLLDGRLSLIIESLRNKDIDTLGTYGASFINGGASRYVALLPCGIHVIKVLYTMYPFGNQCAREVSVFENAPTQLREVLCPIVDSGADWCIMPKVDRVGNCDGMRHVIALAQSYNLSDLHMANVGQWSGRPVIIDYGYDNGPIRTSPHSVDSYNGWDDDDDECECSDCRPHTVCHKCGDHSLDGDGDCPACDRCGECYAWGSDNGLGHMVACQYCQNSRECGVTCDCRTICDACGERMGSVCTYCDYLARQIVHSALIRIPMVTGSVNDRLAFIAGHPVAFGTECVAAANRLLMR